MNAVSYYTSQLVKLKANFTFTFIPFMIIDVPERVKCLQLATWRVVTSLPSLYLFARVRNGFRFGLHLSSVG